MLRFIFYASATYIMQSITLPYSYSNIWEQLLGCIISTIFLNLADLLFYHIAFTFVSNWSSITESTSYEKSRLHWFIRLILACILIACTYLPFISSFITWLTHIIYLWLLNQYNITIQHIISLLSPKQSL